AREHCDRGGSAVSRQERVDGDPHGVDAGGRVATVGALSVLVSHQGSHASQRHAQSSTRGGLAAVAVELITGPLAARKNRLAGSGMVLVRPPEGLLEDVAAAAVFL